jgi:hypothetical protein
LRYCYNVEHLRIEYLFKNNKNKNMFVLSTRDNAMFRGIATFVAIALVAWAAGAAYVRTAEAVNVTDVYDLLSTSATSTASNHTIVFVSPTGISAGQTITLSFDSAGSNFDLTGIGEEDIDILEDGVDQPDTEFTVGTTTNTITITSGTLAIAAGASTTIRIGLHAVSSGSPDSQIINPATQGSYKVAIAGTMTDSGNTEVAIIDSVYVTANVTTSFSFIVTGFASVGTDVNGTTTTGTTSASELPFGNLTAGVIETLSQDLQVTTNAINGFAVTVEVDHQLESSTGADIDGFRDGAFTDTPEAWGASPLNGIASEDQWGHWGITSEDSDLNGNEFNSGGGGDRWISASTTPRTIFSHDGPSDGSTPDIGSTTVGYQLEITALQEAADDYEATLTYIATPTF